MHYLSYTKSRCLNNTLPCFGTCQHYLQAVPSELLSFQHIKWFQTIILLRVAEMQSSLMIHDINHGEHRNVAE